MKGMFESALTGISVASAHSTGGPPISARQIASVVDPKLLTALPRFSGKDEEFLEWEVKVLSMCGLLGLDEKMKEAAKVQRIEDIQMANMDQEAQDQAKLQRLSLPCYCKQCRARRLPFSWVVRTRTVMTPKFSADRLFSEQLTEWRQLIQEYRKATNKELDDGVKVAILTSQSPPNVRALVVQAAARCGENYARLEKEILDTEVGARTYTNFGVLINNSSSTSGAVPMDIGAIGASSASSLTCQLCGKRGHDAKSCWTLGGKRKRLLQWQGQRKRERTDKGPRKRGRQREVFVEIKPSVEIHWQMQLLRQDGARGQRLQKESSAEECGCCQ
eukprot:5460558-Amphidinium_carterae.2